MYSQHSKAVVFALFSAAFVTFSSSASAVNQGDWLARVGVGYVSPNDSSGAVTGIAGSGVSVDSAVSIDLTIAYMITPNVNIELLGSWPFKHDINGTGTIAGLGKVGETKQLPPTLMVDYVFNPQSNIRPYVGAGLNYTTFFKTKSTASLNGALGPTDIDLDNSWGAAAQAGVDVDLNDDWYFNASIWYMNIDTKATLNSTSGSVATTRTVDVTIDPWALSVGIGTRF